MSDPTIQESPKRDYCLVALRTRFKGDEKPCSICKVVKARGEFNTLNRGCGMTPACKKCTSDGRKGKRKPSQSATQASRRRTSSKYRTMQRVAKLRQHGLTYDHFHKMLRQQSYRCRICQVKFDSAIPIRRVSIDHCHETGQVRGLLCNRCNAGLGLLGDSPASLSRARRYLKRHQKGQPHECAPSRAERRAVRPASRGSQAKLTEEMVHIIKLRLLSGDTQTDIAKDAGVRQAAISDLSRGVTWAGVGPTREPVSQVADRAQWKKGAYPPRFGEHSPRAKLTSAQVIEIRRLRAEQRMPYRVIAERFHVSKSLVSQILGGTIWTHLLPASSDI